MTDRIVRWQITRHVTTQTPMHLGDGDSEPGKKAPTDDETPLVATVARDADRNPYLPGSSLRGAVRAALLHRFSHAPDVQARILGLFGFGPKASGAAWTEALSQRVTERDGEDREKKITEGLKNGLGGQLQFLNAFLADDRLGHTCCRNTRPETPAIPDPTNQAISNDCPVEASVAIDPATRAAADRQLAHRQVVPPGTVFVVEVTAGPIEPEDVALLLDGLAMVGQPGHGLGGGRNIGAGRLQSWSGIDEAEIRGIDGAGIVDWMDAAAKHDGSVLNNALQPIGDAIRQRIRAAFDVLTAKAAPPNSAVLSLRLIFDAPFLVKDPVRSGQQPAGGAGAVPRLGPDDMAILPARSFKGVLRARAQRIERTLFGDGGKPIEGDPDTHGHDCELTATDWLFGATSWGSPLEISDFGQVAGETPDDRKTQHFVAIDRFTGGQSSGKLFQVAPVHNAELTGTLALDRDRKVPDAALGLLFLALRDLIDGDITFGFGAAKGYGACHAHIDGCGDAWPALQRAAEAAGKDLTALTTAFRAGASTTQGPQALDLRTQVTPPLAPTALKPGAGPLSTTRFINPYNFVPVLPSDDATKRKYWIANDASGFQAPKPDALGRLRHDRWFPLEDDSGAPLHSGRILCRVTTESPLFIGAGVSAEGDTQTAKTLRHFTLNGVPALPATSLRGMLSALAEAASQSALRVLRDGTLSYRVAAKSDGLPDHVGVVVAATDGTLALRPLYYVPPSARGKREARAKIPEGQPHVPIPDWVGQRYDELMRERTSSDTKGDAACHYINKLNGNAKEYSSQSPKRPLPESSEIAAPTLAVGDTVFYKLDSSGRYADLIAPSQIWRGRVETPARLGALPAAMIAATVHTFFRAIDDSGDLLPFHSARRHISPAELLFGFVAEDFAEPKGASAAVPRPRRVAYAGRVRVSFGRMADEGPGEYYAEPRVLQILSAPKPPSPAFYFRPTPGPTGYIAKDKLNPKTHRPNGRKFYHDHGAVTESTAQNKVGATWHPKENAGQKATIAPVRSGNHFYFHVDFDNLNARELGLLCYVLRPSPPFRHKLGMAKRLGFGRVLIEPMALTEIDRISRYTKPGGTDRVHRLAAIDEMDRVALLQRYPQEMKALAAGVPGDLRALSDVVKAFTGSAETSRATLAALERMGEPVRSDAPIRQPQLAGYEDDDAETETFRWYTRNDDPRTTNGRQVLPPVTDASAEGKQGGCCPDLSLPRHRRF